MMAETDAPRALRIGFIGAGQVGTALAWGLSRGGFNVVGAASRTRASAEKLAAGIAGARAYDGAQALSNASDLVFVAVADDAIAATAGAVAWRHGQSIVHCSGATEVSALASAASAGALTGGFHPLQSFTDPEAALRGLPGCTIGIEAEKPLFAMLAGMAQALGCHTIRLPPGARAIYHASANFMGPFVGALLNEGMRLWSTLGVDQDAAFRALFPVMRGMIASIEAKGPIDSLPGAIARADVGTIARHIEALREHAPALLPLYLDLSRRTLPIAEAKGAADPEKLRAIRDLVKR